MTLDSDMFYHLLKFQFLRTQAIVVISSENEETMSPVDVYQPYKL